tara:strand:- start:111 stop:509 length:399 start_codon:yes stop_codon:yes gene_type:complete
MRKELIQAFPSTTLAELSDDYIESHPDLMWDIPEIPLIRAVPLYMLWCIKHPTKECELVFDNTISALNKYARAKSPDNASQDFKFVCSQEQINAVINFLNWCKTSLVFDFEPTLSRAIKNWQAVNQTHQRTP